MRPTVLRCVETILLAAMLAACAGACNRQPQSGSGGLAAGTGATAGKAAAPDTQAAGMQVYLSSGCKSCHGDDLTGKGTLGPPLKGLAAHWDSATLTAYLRDPQAFAATDPRLKEQQQRYTMRMPALPLAPEAETALVDMLLEQ